MRGGVQVHTRVSPEVRDLIKAHGGLPFIIRKFLAENAWTREQHLAEIQRLDAELEKHKAAVVALDALDNIRVSTSGQVNADTLGNNGRQPGNNNHAPRTQTPAEWERSWKPYFMMLASAGRLKDSDKEIIVRKMKLRGPVTAEDWIFSESPEQPPIGVLEKCRYIENPNAVCLYRLLLDEKISGPLYKSLMDWLGLPSIKEVDKWIMEGVQEEDQGVLGMSESRGESP